MWALPLAILEDLQVIRILHVLIQIRRHKNEVLLELP